MSQNFLIREIRKIISLQNITPARYLAKAADLHKDADPLQWWMNHSKDLPCWSAAAEKILLA